MTRPLGQCVGFERLLGRTSALWLVVASGTRRFRRSWMKRLCLDVCFKNLGSLRAKEAWVARMAAAPRLREERSKGGARPRPRAAICCLVISSYVGDRNLLIASYHI